MRAQRSNKMDEVLQGIRIIKYFAWEKSFRAGIYEAPLPAHTPPYPKSLLSPQLCHRSALTAARRRPRLLVRALAPRCKGCAEDWSVSVCGGRAMLHVRWAK